VEEIANPRYPHVFLSHALVSPDASRGNGENKEVLQGQVSNTCACVTICACTGAGRERKWWNKK